MKSPYTLFVAAVCAAALLSIASADSPPETTFKVYFSPRGGTARAVEEAIDRAGREIRVCMYSFASPSIAWRLVCAARRGVDVEVILDEEENLDSRFSSARDLERNGISVKYARPPSRKGDSSPAKLHHKFAVVDGKTVLTGSFNWSVLADTSNHENLVVAESTELAARFLGAYAAAEKISRRRK